jgi:antitoxin component of MazEF toxin-antitoxin module
MEMPCRVKSIGGSKYIVINTLILRSLNLTDGDIVIVDFKKKIENIEV